LGWPAAVPSFSAGSAARVSALGLGAPVRAAAGLQLLVLVRPDAGPVRATSGVLLGRGIRPRPRGAQLETDRTSQPARGGDPALPPGGVCGVVGDGGGVGTRDSAAEAIAAGGARWAGAADRALAGEGHPDGAASGDSRSVAGDGVRRALAPDLVLSGL